MNYFPVKKVTEEQMKKRWQELQEVQGYTDEELSISRSNPEYVKVMEYAPQFIAHRIVVEVVEAHNCIAGHKAVSSFYGKREDVPERGVEVETGNPSATPTMIAAWQVQEVTKIVTGIGKPLRNRLLLLEAAEGIAEVIQLA